MIVRVNFVDRRQPDVLVDCPPEEPSDPFIDIEGASGTVHAAGHSSGWEFEWGGLLEFGDGISFSEAHDATTELIEPVEDFDLAARAIGHHHDRDAVALGDRSEERRNYGAVRSRIKQAGRILGRLAARSVGSKVGRQRHDLATVSCNAIEGGRVTGERIFERTRIRHVGVSTRKVSALEVWPQIPGVGASIPDLANRLT